MKEGRGSDKWLSGKCEIVQLENVQVADLNEDLGKFEHRRHGALELI